MRWRGRCRACCAPGLSRRLRARRRRRRRSPRRAARDDPAHRGRDHARRWEIALSTFGFQPFVGGVEIMPDGYRTDADAAPIGCVAVTDTAPRVVYETVRRRRGGEAELLQLGPGRRYLRCGRRSRADVDRRRPRRTHVRKVRRGSGSSATGPDRRQAPAWGEQRRGRRRGQRRRPWRRRWCRPR